MLLIGKDDLDPTEEDLCKWVAYESLFIEPKSVSKYLFAIRYYLEAYGKGTPTKSPLVRRMIRSISIKYGLPARDDRENVTVDLLSKIMKKIDLKNHVHRCCMAASVSKLPAMRRIYRL